MSRKDMTAAQRRAWNRRKRESQAERYFATRVNDDIILKNESGDEIARFSDRAGMRFYEGLLRDYDINFLGMTHNGQD